MGRGLIGILMDGWVSFCGLMAKYIIGYILEKKASIDRGLLRAK